MIEKQVIFIMFTMGIVGGLGCYIWYRRKQLPDKNMERDRDRRDGIKETQRNAEEKAKDDDDESAAVHNSSQKLHKKTISRSSRPLAVYVPPHARTTPRGRGLTSKQPHPRVLNAHSKEKSMSSSSLPATHLEKVPAKKQPHPPMSSADADYIVTIKIPLWLISRFIGKQGCMVKSLRQLSGADFKVIRNPVTECSHTSCNIIGSRKQIEAALKLIGQRFPEVTLPNCSNMKLFHGSRHKPVVKQQQHQVHSGIAPAVIPPTPFLAFISHIDSLSSIWIHVVDSSGPCPWQELHEKMVSTYTFASSLEEIETVNVIGQGQFYAVRTDDDNFARGVVKEVHTDNGEYVVFLVDFGKHITSTGDKLIPLRYTLYVFYVPYVYTCGRIGDSSVFN